ncbi:MAG: hypothetical protein K2X35_09675 [Bryobacteraceae bacterium]|nr:hypothetical protein [Bryobacteraceae bacterium]
MKPTILLPLVGTLLTAGPLYQIADLGSLGGGSSAAFAINASGAAVGASRTASAIDVAFRNDDALLYPLAAARSTAAAINDSGIIAGTVFGPSGGQAVLWSNGQANAIAGPGSYAMGLNNSGSATGSVQGSAFRWGAGALETLNLGWWSAGYAINASGAIAGYAEIAPGKFAAFLWDGNNVALLPSVGGRTSYALALNDEGTVAGSSTNQAGYGRATMWRKGAAVDLGTLGGAASFAHGINATGLVVGASFDSSNSCTRAFLFQNGIMLDLNSLLLSRGGWLLTAAYGINESGQIAGTGIYRGEYRAFRLDPVFFAAADGFPEANPVPEPAAWWLAITGIALVAAKRR